MGFEPMTSCLLDRRSNQLSYGALQDDQHLINYFIKLLQNTPNNRVGKFFIYETAGNLLSNVLAFLSDDVIA